jgi:phosphomannomutase/phosphoglucomutase
MKERDAIVGGEENGGFIYKKWSWARDGILSTLSLLDLMASEEKTLSELDELFPEYHQLKVNISCPKEKYGKVMEHVKSNIPDDYEKMTTIDGIRADYSSNDWLCIRPSGTEPLIRVFCEARTLERAEKLSALGKRIVKEGING